MQVSGGTGPISPPPPPPKPEQQVLEELHALQAKREGAAAAGMPIDEATLGAYHLEGVRSETELHALVEAADMNQDGAISDQEFDDLYEARFRGQYDETFDSQTNLETQYDTDRTVVEATAATDLRAATAKFQDLQGQVDAANEELARDLARFGPALTPAQQADYVQRFKDSFTLPGSKEKLFDAYKSAENQLADTLSSHADAFAALMTDTRMLPGGLRDQVMDAFKQIAHSPDPAVAAKALPFARLATDPTLVPAGTDMKAFAEFANQVRADILEPASVAKATVEIKAGKDPAEAIGEQQSLAQHLAEAWETVEKDKKLALGITKSLTVFSKSAKSTVDAVHAALSGNAATAVKSLAGTFEAGEAGSAARALAMVGLLGSAATLAAKSRGKESQDLLDATKEVLTTSKQGGELVENMLKVGAGLAGDASGAGQALGKAAAAAGDLMERITPMLGVGIGVMSAMQKARDGKWLGAGAELGSAVAAVLTSTVVGAPVGIVLQCGCTLLSMLDDALAEGDRLNKDTAKAQGVLKAVLAGDPALHAVPAATRDHLASVLASNTQDHMAQLAHLGLTAQTIQQLGVSGYADALVASGASDDVKYVDQLQTLLRPRSPKDPGANVDLAAFLTSMPPAERGTVVKGLASLCLDLQGSWGNLHANAGGASHFTATWFRNAIKVYGQEPAYGMPQEAVQAAGYLDRFIDNAQARVLHGH